MFCWRMHLPFLSEFQNKNSRGIQKYSISFGVKRNFISDKEAPSTLTQISWLVLHLVEGEVRRGGKDKARSYQRVNNLQPNPLKFECIFRRVWPGYSELLLGSGSLFLCKLKHKQSKFLWRWAGFVLCAFWWWGEGGGNWLDTFCV